MPTQLLDRLPCVFLALDHEDRPTYLSAAAKHMSTLTLDRVREVATLVAEIREGGEVAYQHRDGTRWLRWRKVEGPPPHPEWSAWYVGVDATGAREARGQLLASEERLRLLSEATTEAVAIHDGEVVLDCNGAFTRIFGYARDEVIGRPVLDFADAESQSAIIEAIRSGAPGPYRAVGRRADGSTFTGELRASETEQNESLVRIVSIRDITEEVEAEEKRRKLESQMLHAQKLESLGLLAGGIAHDFNNLLVGILGNAGLVRRRLSRGEAAGAEELLDAIEKSATRAAEHTQQLLAYSGRGRFVVRPLDLNEVVQETAQLLGATLHAHATVRFGLQPDLPLVEADPSQIHQVVMNLLLNASDALDDLGGVIQLETGIVEVGVDDSEELLLEQELDEGAYVYVKVTDTGEGMDEHTLQRIFEPFFTTKFTGRGLGLAAVLGIVRGHGGAIEVYSQPGEGTTFMMLLPGTEDEITEEVDDPSSNPHLTFHGQALVVDDEPAVREMARIALEDAGFEVLTAEDGIEAIEICEAHRESLSFVLLDLTMPRLDGTATLKALRERGVSCPVVLTSGYDVRDTVAAELRPAGFLHKPYRVSELLRVARAATGLQPVPS